MQLRFVFIMKTLLNNAFKICRGKPVGCYHHLTASLTPQPRLSVCCFNFVLSSFLSAAVSSGGEAFHEQSSSDYKTSPSDCARMYLKDSATFWHTL